MRTDWRLGDLVKIRHGFAFKGEHFSSEGDKVLLSPGNFRIGGGMKLKGAKEKFYTGDFPSQYELSEGDLIVAMTDLTPTAPILGSPARVPADGTFLHNQRLGLIVDLNRKVLASSYLYYTLCDDSFRAKVRASATGSTVRHTAPERILSITVSLPCMKTQLKVAAVLSAYDELIAANRRRIAVIEEVIHAHFKILVDGARASSAPTLARFTSIVSVNPRIEAPAAQIRYLPMSSLSTSDMTLGSFEVRDRSTGVRFENGDTLMARITPSLQNGKTGFVDRLTDGEVACGSTEFIVLRGRSVSPAYTYCLARSELVRSTAIGSMTGATGRQRVSVAAFDELYVPVPEHHKEAAFADEVGPMFKSIQALADLNRNLEAQRDRLLPRLISGAVDVGMLDIDFARIREREAQWGERARVDEVPR